MLCRIVSHLRPGIDSLCLSAKKHPACSFFSEDALDFLHRKKRQETNDDQHTAREQEIPSLAGDLFNAIRQRLAVNQRADNFLREREQYHQELGISRGICTFDFFGKDRYT